MDARLCLKTQTKISQQQIMASTLLHMSAAEMEQLICRELADNPALELAHEWNFPSPKQVQTFSPDNYSTRSSTSQRDPSLPTYTGLLQEIEDVTENFVAHPSAIDQLAAQVALLVDQQDLDIAVDLLYALDGHGYLRASPEDLAEELGVGQASVERLVQVLHELEPPGIGARDLRECFLIQCAHLTAEGVNCRLVYRILIEAWEDFVQQHWVRIAHKMGVPGSIIEDARRFISQNLYPYPLSMLADSSAKSELLSSADLIIQRGNSGDRFVYSIEVPGAEEYELRVSTDFEHALCAKTSVENVLSSVERAWITTYVNQARLFVSALRQRWTTLRRIGEYLIDYQVDFLERGARYLKPLTRAMVASALGCHESTVSRAVRDKFAQLPNGRFIPLSDFFDDSLATKEAIRQILTRTNRTLSDREIAERLQVEGFTLARRTIAKYRKLLHLPTSHQQQHKLATQSAQHIDKRIAPVV